MDHSKTGRPRGHERLRGPEPVPARHLKRYLQEGGLRGGKEEEEETREEEEGEERFVPQFRTIFKSDKIIKQESTRSTRKGERRRRTMKRTTRTMKKRRKTKTKEAR